MRIPSLLLAACAAMLMTTGCMTDDSMAKNSRFDDNIDYRKVNRIDDQAARSGHTVVWVNMPVKRRLSRSEQVGIN